MFFVHFREILNVTLGVPNLVADGEIHATIHEIKQFHLSDVPLV